MSLGAYFEKASGLGVLATADSDGRVGSAIYGRPYVLDEENIAFIMADRLMHHNLQSNPHAAYLFKEDGKKYVGKRLYLTKTKEEKNGEMMEKIRRKKYPELEGEDEFLVYFHVDEVLPLKGNGKK